MQATCESKYVPVAQLERTVLEQVIKILGDHERILAEAKYLSEQGIDGSRAVGIGKEIEKIEEHQRRLADLYINGSLPHNILEPKSEELSQHRLRLESENSVLEAPLPQGLDLDLLVAALPDATARIKVWVS